MIVNEINQIRELIELFAPTHEVFEKINSERASWTSQALQILSEQTLEGYHASLIFAQIKEPSYNLIIAKIDTYIQQQNKSVKYLFP